MRSFNKVFGIGLCRTGTRSLAEALTVLGARSTDYVDARTFNQLIGGDFKLDVLAANQGMANMASAVFYPQLDRRYPGSLFILTTRDLDDWLLSMRGHMGERDQLQHVPEKRRQYEQSRFFFAAALGCVHWVEERLRYAYERHYFEAVEYFQRRDRQLLVLDICGGVGGWLQLCGFLDADQPKRPFPHVHDLPNAFWPNRGKKVVR